MHDWRLRRADPTDAPALASCVEAAYHHYIPRIGKPPGPMPADYAEVIAHHQVWVVEAERQMIGGLVLIPEEDALLLDNIAVHPDDQGCGIGRALLELADAQALCQGYGELRLYTHEHCTRQNLRIPVGGRPTLCQSSVHVLIHHDYTIILNIDACSVLRF